MSRYAHGSAHAYAPRSCRSWQSPLRGGSSAKPSTRKAKTAVLSAVVTKPAPKEMATDLPTPPSPKAKRRMDIAKLSLGRELPLVPKAPLAPPGTAGRITINDVTLTGQTAGLNAFNERIHEILDEWAVGAEKEYRKVTGHRLLLDGNGRSRITERGERLENFYCMCKDMGGDRRAHGKSRRQEVHLTFARAQEDGEIIAILEWVVHYSNQSNDWRCDLESRKHAEISQAVSKRVMDKSLPRGVMTALVQYIAEQCKQMGIASIAIKKMHQTAVTYWNQCGLNYRGVTPENVLGAVASRCELAVDVCAFELDTPAVAALR